MAVTRMLAGLCTAGFSREPDPVTHLCWVRPVREHGHVLLGDLTDRDGQVIRPWDVVELCVQSRRPEPPHTEDVLCDFIRHRPRVVRRLDGERRARFLAAHLDCAAEEVLCPRPARSLCLVRPDELWATFEIDGYSGKYEARMGFTLNGAVYPLDRASKGLPVTDLQWRAWGREQLGRRGGRLRFDHRETLARLGADEIYLALGLSRNYQGRCWPMIIGVHAVPDYTAAIDYEDL